MINTIFTPILGGKVNGPMNPSRIEPTSLYVVRELQDHLSTYGYEYQKIATIAETDLFLVKAGDQVVSRLLAFERSGQSLALRPEFTALALDHYLRTIGPGIPVRWQFGGPVFSERPTAPHDTYKRLERQNVGAELIGQQGAGADAEILAAAWHGLHRLHLQGNSVRIRVGHSGLVRAMLNTHGVNRRIARQIIGRLQHLIPGELEPDTVSEKLMDWLNDQVTQPLSTATLNASLITQLRSATTNTPGRSTLDIARRLEDRLLEQNQADQLKTAIHRLAQWSMTSGTIDEALPKLASMIDAGSQEEITYFKQWTEAIGYLADYGITTDAIVIEPALSRAWEYYSGMVFDLEVDGHRVGGGGRYDDLGELVGSLVPIPAVGFVYDVDQIVAFSSFSNDINQKSFVVVAENMSDGIYMTQYLRSQGLWVRLEQAAYIAPSAAASVYVAAGGVARFEGVSYDRDHYAEISAVMRGYTSQ